MRANKALETLRAELAYESRIAANHRFHVQVMREAQEYAERIGSECIAAGRPLNRERDVRTFAPPSARRIYPHPQRHLARSTPLALGVAAPGQGLTRGTALALVYGQRQR